jgi:hypothetical protein
LKCEHVFRITGSPSIFVVVVDHFEGIQECTKCGAWVYRNIEKESIEMLNKKIRGEI